MGEQQQNLYLKRLDESDVNKAIDLFAYAYPGLNLFPANAREGFHKRILDINASEGPVSFQGLYRDGQLVGGMRFHDFRMNLLGTRVDAGGVGMVAVDFLHKREKIAKDLVTEFIRHYHQRGAVITLLYAFRTDFYQQMGFGFGPKMHQYKVPPARFPKGPSKAHVRLLSGADDKALLTHYYQHHVDRTHGLIEKTEAELDALFNNPETHIAAYVRDGKMGGYFIFQFKPENSSNFGSNNMHVRELFYDTPEGLSEFMTFLHSQSDQIRFVVLNTDDNFFYHNIPDARNDSDNMLPHVFHETNVSGVALMYRVVDTKGVFLQLCDHAFGHETLTVHFRIKDTLWSVNNGSVVVWFIGGLPTVLPDDATSDVRVDIDVSHFSSLLVGAISFRKLMQYGLVHVSDDAYTEALHRMFFVEEPPRCTTGF